jgi:hypothetical protein
LLTDACIDEEESDDSSSSSAPEVGSAAAIAARRKFDDEEDDGDVSLYQQTPLGPLFHDIGHLTYNFIK